jgi:putative endonuclease
MYYVYALKNESNKIYIGQTEDLNKRLARHNGELPSKLSSYTFKNKQDGVWELFYSESADSRSSAMLREKQLKSYQGRLFLKSLIK